jgi:hypothetical protein
VPTDERKGRRLGDETKGRIADLASGWTVEASSPSDPDSLREPLVANPSVRRATKTQPPPPPGSPERQALEANVVELTDDAEPDEDEEDEAQDEGHGRHGDAPRAAALMADVDANATQRRHAGGLRNPPAGSTAPIDVSVAATADSCVREPDDVDSALATAEALAADPLVFDRRAISADPRSTLAAERVINAYRTGRTPRPAPAEPPARGSTPGGMRPVGTDANAAIDGVPTRAAHGSRPDVVPEPDESDPDAPREPTRPPRAATRLAVPMGEFDDGDAVEQDKLRAAYSQATSKRDVALAHPAAPVMRSDPRFHDASGSSTTRFERDDAPAADRNDATMLSVPSTGPVSAGGLLRNPASLPRRAGIAGELRYPITVLFGLRRARRELAALELQQVTRQHSRRHHLVTLGRTAVALADSLRLPDEHPAVHASREGLSQVEVERELHAGEVIAADAELTAVRNDRESTAQQHAAALAAIDAELAELAVRLAPLDREAIQVKKRARSLHEVVRRIDAKIAEAEASLASGRADKVDPSAVQAEIATLRAERKAVQLDEPVIAGELDALDPRIAALEATRAETQRRRAEQVAAERDDQERVEELRVAIGARRKVVDRAAAAAEARRDVLLFQLGERLCVDRPADLTSQLSPIDEIDVELGSADRRIMELREILSSVDRMKLVRGLALLAVILGALGALAAWLVPRMLA